MADAALCLLQKKGYAESRFVRSEMFKEGVCPSLMRQILEDDLHLISNDGGRYRLTDRGRLAVMKGFENYIAELDREAVEITIDRRMSILSGLYSLIGGGLVALLTWFLSRCES